MQPLIWGPPHLLANYARAPRAPGIYAIGRARDPALPVSPTDEIDPYLRNWPDNLEGLYVGISEDRRAGIRGRLSKHARGRGSRYVAQQIRAGQPLWYIAAAGDQLADYEALFLTLTTIFVGNVRPEGQRMIRRMYQRIDADDGA